MLGVPITLTSSGPIRCHRLLRQRPDQAGELSHSPSSQHHLSQQQQTVRYHEWVGRQNPQSGDFNPYQQQNR